MQSNQSGSSKLERLECTSNQAYCNASYSTANLMARDKSFMTVGCNLIKPLEKASVRLVLYYRFQVYKKFLIDVTEDLCAYQKGKNSGKILQLFMPFIKTKTEIFNQTCPFIGNMTVDNLRYGSYLFPHLMPAGQYRLDIDIVDQNVHVWMLQVFFRISSDGMQNFGMG